MTVTMYHNPRCSKSRATLALLQERGISPEIIEYLKTPPSEAELDHILLMLDKEPDELMRKGEAEYKEHIQGKILSRPEVIALMVANPVVIERPIVVKDGRAAVGRPPESVLDVVFPNDCV